MGREIKVLDVPRNYILSPDALSRQRQVIQGMTNDNNLWFRIDYNKTRLAPYIGTAVLYLKGNLCGQAEDPQKLLATASKYYNSSDISVFVVPENEDGLAKAIEEAGQRKF